MIYILPPTALDEEQGTDKLLTRYRTVPDIYLHMGFASNCNMLRINTLQLSTPYKDSGGGYVVMMSGHRPSRRNFLRHATLFTTCSLGGVGWREQRHVDINIVVLCNSHHTSSRIHETEFLIVFESRRHGKLIPYTARALTLRSSFF